MCGLGEPVGAVLARERTFVKIQNGVIKKWQIGNFDKRFSRGDFFFANARARLTTSSDARSWVFPFHSRNGSPAHKHLYNPTKYIAPSICPISLDSTLLGRGAFLRGLSETIRMQA